ncbi:hypothetical protein DVH05_006174 [Phytophthora capsici]|nr:hypothetical protein DVH05_006174 [Phytophthora capsici]
MTTHGTGETPKALPSPSSRVHASPSDGEPQAEPPVVVDVTGSDAPLTGTSARQTSNPPPLHTSTRAAAKAVSAAALAEARKGKKKLTKRSTPAATSTRRLTRAVLESSESEAEEKSSPPLKKAKKTMCTSRPSVTDVVRPPSTSRAERGFDLATFMETFEPGHGGTEHSRTSQETECHRHNGNDRPAVHVRWQQQRSH